MTIDDALLEGPERDWWRKQREVHEGIIQGQNHLLITGMVGNRKTERKTT